MNYTDGATGMQGIADPACRRETGLIKYDGRARMIPIHGDPPMADAFLPDSPELRTSLMQLYREFFERAEKKRRWSVADDIPWDQVNRSMNPAVADVVESFCAVELYLPDYIGKALPMVRENKGWGWFHANWGYEESKHSLVLGDWLLKSGMRTDEQMADLEADLYKHQYELPQGSSPLGMVTYAMIQELATFVHYRNLRDRVVEIGDPALEKILTFVSVDERSHHAFYRSVVKLFLDMDRERTLTKLREVLMAFKMPAVGMFADGKQRMAQVKALGIFDEDVFMREVYMPMLPPLGLTHADVRGPRIRKSMRES